jgi:glutaconyl-CoA/methylmalonyl-CoA decarboxylase subunit gamma
MKKFVITVNGQPYDVEVEEVKAVKNSKPSSAQSVSASPVAAKSVSVSAPATSGSSKITSPMPGSILKVNVAKGDTVKKGQSLLILEAMKMENDIKAPADGKVVEVKVSQGDCVTLGQTLIEVA